MNIPASRSQRGYTYVGALILLAVLSMAAALTLEVSDTSARRAAEAEVLAVGKEYQRAFASYYRHGQGAGKRFPDRLEDLTRDPRYSSMLRHLRRVYPDPLTGGEWGTVMAPGGGIMAVYSKAKGVPFREDPGQLAMPPLVGASGVRLDEPRSYAQWRFGYDPNLAMVNRSTVTHPMLPRSNQLPH